MTKKEKAICENKIKERYQKMVEERIKAMREATNAAIEAAKKFIKQRERK